MLNLYYYNTINFTDELRNVCSAVVTEVGALSATGWAWSLHGMFRAGRGSLVVLGVVDTRFGVSQPAADAER